MSVAPPVAHPSLPWQRPTPQAPAFVVLPADTPTARRVRSIGGPGVVCARSSHPMRQTAKRQQPE